MNILKIFTAVMVVLIMATNFYSQTGNTVKIGNQVWMVENLNVNVFRNGSAIPEAKTTEEWEMAGEEKKPAWCYYKNDPANGEKFGKLYNWYAVNDNRSLAPKGWHVPSAEEWQTLIDYYGGQEVAGGKMKETGTVHWKGPNTGATNEDGFSALPGGHRDHNANLFNIGHYATFWTSTECNKINAWKRHLSHGDVKVYNDCLSKSMGFSVRCVKD
jgi:uncharacterized protein (TIGR02145 family)